MKTATIDLRALAAISYAVSKEETRYYLNGVLLEIGSDAVNYVATDGHLLAATRRFTEANSLDGDLIIPTSVCRQFKLKRGANAEAVLTHIDGRKLSLEYMGSAITFDAIDGVFPDWRRVVPSEFSGEAAQFDSDKLAQLAKVRNVLNDKQRFNGQLSLRHNGGSPALVGFGQCDDANAFAVIMPFRGYSPELAGWVHNRADAERRLRNAA